MKKITKTKRVKTTKCCNWVLPQNSFMTILLVTIILFCSLIIIDQL